MAEATSQRDAVLSKRIRAIRKSKGMTLNEVESICGVTASTISKIENGGISPTYANLIRLANGLGVDMVHLVSDEESRPVRTRRSITREGDGPVHSIGTHEYRMLATDLADKKMTPMIATIRANTLEEVRAADTGDDEGMFSHEGEEVLFVVSGEVILHTDHYTPIHLKTGDSAYIDSTMGHVCLRGSDEDAVVFWVCSDGGTENYIEEIQSSLKRN